MNNWIDRYVFDVTRRLPEKEREDVSRELTSNIYDMLPENAGENEVKSVLTALGSPASLAEKYRQKPRYLISPAYYDEYVRVLKWVLPLISVLVMTIGMVVAAIGSFKDGLSDTSAFWGGLVSSGISMGISAAFQSLVWITIGFVIADRTDAKITEGGTEEWKLEDLPDITSAQTRSIPLSDTVTELILTLVFSVAAIFACLGAFPVMIIHDGTTQIRTLFSPSFCNVFIPAIAVMAALSVCESVLKIRWRRWTPAVCGAVIVRNLTDMGIMVYLLNRRDIFSEEFSKFLQEWDWSRFDVLNVLSFMGNSGVNLIPVLICTVVVISSLAGCCKAVYNTIKSRKTHVT